MSNNTLSYFSARVLGHRGSVESTCLADKQSGLSALLQSKVGQITCSVHNLAVSKRLRDFTVIRLIKYSTSSGKKNKSYNIYDGPLNPRSDKEFYNGLSKQVKKIVLEYSEE